MFWHHTVFSGLRTLQSIKSIELNYFTSCKIWTLEKSTTHFYPPAPNPAPGNPHNILFPWVMMRYLSFLAWFVFQVHLCYWCKRHWTVIYYQYIFQCFKRAMVWEGEWWSSQGERESKPFLQGAPSPPGLGLPSCFLAATANSRGSVLFTPEMPMGKKYCNFDFCTYKFFERNKEVAVIGSTKTEESRLCN